MDYCTTVIKYHWYFNIHTAYISVAMQYRSTNGISLFSCATENHVVTILVQVLEMLIPPPALNVCCKQHRQFRLNKNCLRDWTRMARICIGI